MDINISDTSSLLALGSLIFILITLVKIDRDNNGKIIIHVPEGNKKYLLFFSAIMFIFAIGLSIYSSGSTADPQVTINNYNNLSQTTLEQKPVSISGKAIPNTSETSKSETKSVGTQPSSLQTHDKEAVSCNGTKLKEINSQWAKQVLWSPDSKLLAIATYGLFLYDTQNYDEVLKLSIGWVHGVAFSPDGKILATAQPDGVKLWSTNGGGEKGTITDSNAKCVVFSPDGTKLAVGIDMAVKLFDIATKSELNTLNAKSVGAVSFSPDGQILATSDGENISLWDTINGEKIHTLGGHDNRVNSVAFSPDGKILASGSVDKTIKLWDTENGYLLRTIDSQHADQIQSVAFSPDGKLLASGSWDLTIKLWEVSNGKELSKLTGHTHWINSVAFSPDGKLLASGADDDKVRIWKIE